MLRSLLIESSWIATKHDPALLKKHTDMMRNKGRSSQKAIVHVAKTLLRRIYHVWREEEEYQTGIL